jgi:hypothetical protein
MRFVRHGNCSGRPSRGRGSAAASDADADSPLLTNRGMTTFTVASNEFLGGGKEKAEYHATWVGAA